MDTDHNLDSSCPRPNTIKQQQIICHWTLDTILIDGSDSDSDSDF